ncbi:MAG TPA: TRAP transporter TatT component family protein [Pyrinomonadaceae bacterium]|nr:TRAP transporter TatT component family protein [Pyrinomonadaceae bacterium]
MRNKNGFKRFCQALLLAWLSIFVLSSCSSRPEISAGAQDKAQAAGLVEEADKLYKERAELSRTREAILMLRRAVAADTESYDAAWRLSRLNYFLGAHTKDEAERDRAYSEGVEAGRRAVKIQGGKAEGHFWLGANLGGQAQTSLLSGLTAVDEIRREMQKVIQLDEGFQGGSAYMALGQVDLEAPRMMGGDSKRAVEVLEKGLRFGENNTSYRLRLAQAYMAVGRTEDARRQLDLIINSTPDPDYLPEHGDALSGARKLLTKLEGK